MSLTLAIDQSTSATKAILFDAVGNVVASTSREHKQIYPQPAWVEHDADEIWANTQAVIAKIASERSSEIDAISITNQRETILVFDRATGKPLHHAIVWQCRRGDAICQSLRDAGHDELIRTKTGLKIDTYFSASKLKWLIAQRPDIAAKLRSGEALVGTIDAYLIYRLTGGKVFATDHTNASRTLLYDIGRLAWDEQLCSLFDVPMRALPEVRECCATFGHTATGLLPREVPIVGVMGDSQAALFAQRCYQPGQGKATFGTGTSLMVNVGHSWKPPEGGVVAALAWVCNGQPSYALEGLINYSAATVAWLKDQLHLINDTAEAEPLARSVEDNGGVYLVPAFAGLSAPYWNADARGAIIGMSAYTRREHIVRAALESISYQIRDLLDVIRPALPGPLISLNADGGPTRNSFIMQFTADLAGVDLVVGDVPEASAWGATLAGLLGRGVYRDFAALTAVPRSQRTFKPTMPAETASKLLSGWRAAVRRTL